MSSPLNSRDAPRAVRMIMASARPSPKFPTNLSPQSCQWYKWCVRCTPDFGAASEETLLNAFVEVFRTETNTFRWRVFNQRRPRLTSEIASFWAQAAATPKVNPATGTPVQGQVRPRPPRPIDSPYAKAAFAALQAPLDKLTPVTDEMLRNLLPATGSTGAARTMAGATAR